jgi:spore germination cell wall hydrolase CwlJ-like protein
MLVSPLDPEQHHRRRQTMKLISNTLTLFIIVALAVMVLHGKPRQQASTDLSEGELFYLTQAIYHEARGEDALGQAAVAHVILNRVKSPLFPDSVREVVWQPDQFSFTNDGRSDRMTDLEAIGKAVDIALAASRGKIKDSTGGALHYYAHERVRPYWSSRGHRLVVGDHTFVKLAGK